jgi:hypothetical protein
MACFAYCRVVLLVQSIASNEALVGTPVSELLTAGITYVVAAALKLASMTFK